MANLRPGPVRILPWQAPGGVVFRGYHRNGALLFERAVRPGDPCGDFAEADATTALVGGAFLGDVVLVCYDGDSGEYVRQSEYPG